MRSLRRVLAATVFICSTSVSVGCTIGPVQREPVPLPTHRPAPTSAAAAPAPATTTVPPPAPSSAVPIAAAPACVPAAFDCDMQQRILRVDRYVATRPGTVGYVLRDRLTGAVHRNAQAGELIWTASTIKLAMVVDLLTRDHAGSIRFTAADRDAMARMLHTSDDEAADALWFRYSGPDHMAFNDDFPKFGMTGVIPQRGFSEFFPYWGFQKCTADDLDHLMTHVLTNLSPADTADIVRQMQNVDPVQQWGVWGAGAAQQPGNKDGWSEEEGGWVVNSVGFAGPDQRYTLAVMNSLEGEGGFEDGTETVTELAQLLLAGR